MHNTCCTSLVSRHWCELHDEKLLPYNSANSVVPGNEASVTLNVHGVVVRYMYTQSLSAGSLYTACVSDMRACSKNSPGESQYFHRT